jgi:hypothetical protein
MAASSSSVGAAESAAPGHGSEVQSPYPDFKEYFVTKPADCLPVRINTIEQNFFILQRTKGKSRTTTTRAMCAFCAHSFQCMSLTKMRVHLTGEAEGDCRVEKCLKVPADCRTYYQKERDDKATSARQKRSIHIDLVNETMCRRDEALAGTEPAALDKSLTTKARVAPQSSRVLTAASNLKNVTQLSLHASMVIIHI